MYSVIPLALRSTDRTPSIFSVQVPPHAVDSFLGLFEIEHRSTMFPWLVVSSVFRGGCSLVLW
jgi:hypothetical protein